jgi:eukaryotic-like serine/threonine-protein kinase
MSDAVERLRAALADRYAIEREVGAGGMATVYLAQDLRHDRKVAIKVLRPELAAVIGAERFLAEIRVTAHLQHPHILGLIDSGAFAARAGDPEDRPYYVMPYIEGESLRARLTREKQLPIADAVRIATEAGSALDYAHRHGIIHRDIKPENILLHDGQALVADFGIALAASKAGGTRMTETGMSLGTPTYMSPEQAMGEREITARSDVYALGAMTYEMLVGEPPFTGPTAQAIVGKVLSAEPASLIAQRHTIPAHIETAVLTALEKLPADRFATAAGFAQALTAGAAVERGDPGTRVGRTARATSRPHAAWLATAAVVAGTALALGFLAGRSHPGMTPFKGVSFAQQTFQEEAIFNARFAPDGRTIVYSAAGEGAVPELFIIRPDYPEPRALGLPATHLLGVSSRGELAVLVRAQWTGHRLFRGTLARVPLEGGAPREMLDDIREADWSPDGSELAVIHAVNGKDRLEFPIGSVRYESVGYLSDPRVSPDGKRVAFAEHPTRFDDRGTIDVVDQAGKKTVLTADFAGIEGLAWSPQGDEVVFSAASGASAYLVHAVSLGGRLRVVLPGPGNLTTLDISHGGRLLLSRDDTPTRIMVRAPGAAQDRDESWLDFSVGPRLSRDGRLLTFSDESNGAGLYYSVMLRKTDGSPVARLGDGEPRDFSSDGSWVLATVYSKPPRLMLYPTGAGAERRIDAGQLEAISGAAWFPDDRSVLVCGNEAGHATRCYVQPLAGGPPRPVTPEGTTIPEGPVGSMVSPDARSVIVRDLTKTYRRYSLVGDSARAIPGLTPNDQIVRWSPDGRALWVRRGGEIPARVERLDLVTGRREPLIEVGPRDQPGNIALFSIALADDPKVYAYGALQYVSHLFVVDGVR